MPSYTDYLKLTEPLQYLQTFYSSFYIIATTKYLNGQQPSSEPRIQCFHQLC